MALFSFSMFLLEVNLLICLQSPYILLLFGLLLRSWAFTMLMPTLRGGDKDIIYILLLFILIEISYTWFSFIIIKYSVLLGFTFPFIWWEIVFYILHKGSNKSISKQTLFELFFTKPFLDVFVRILSSFSHGYTDLTLTIIFCYFLHLFHFIYILADIIISPFTTIISYIFKKCVHINVTHACVSITIYKENSLFCVHNYLLLIYPL